MKKIYPLLLSVLFFTACEKTKELKWQDENDASRHEGGGRNECMLTNVSSEYGQESFEYGKKDLLDKWTIQYPDYDVYFLLERNSAGRLLKANCYDASGTLINIIKFTYKGNDAVKDTWYDPVTNEVVDELVYTRNHRGKIIKAVSEIGDYYTVFTYTPDGDNLKRWKYFVGGVATFQGDYTYLNPYKNPFSAVRGLDYGFAFLNSPFYNNKLYSTSEQFSYFDENGNLVIDSDQDPAKTVATANSKNFVVTSDFYNILSDDYVHFVFDYENCGSCKNCNTKTTSNGSSTATRIGHQVNLSKLLLRGSAESIKEKIRQFRKAQGY